MVSAATIEAWVNHLESVFDCAFNASNGQLIWTDGPMKADVKDEIMTEFDRDDPPRMRQRASTDTLRRAVERLRERYDLDDSITLDVHEPDRDGNPAIIDCSDRDAVVDDQFDHTVGDVLNQQIQVVHELRAGRRFGTVALPNRWYVEDDSDGTVTVTTPKGQCYIEVTVGSIRAFEHGSIEVVRSIDAGSLDRAVARAVDLMGKGKIVPAGTDLED